MVNGGIFLLVVIRIAFLVYIISSGLRLIILVYGNLWGLMVVCGGIQVFTIHPELNMGM